MFEEKLFLIGIFSAPSNGENPVDDIWHLQHALVGPLLEQLPLRAAEAVVERTGLLSVVLI